jgi:hypothetical protein
VQKGDLRAAVAPISLSYVDTDGLSRDGIKGLLFREFRRSGPITSLLGPIVVDFDEEIEGEAATAHATFDAILMSGFSPLDGSLLPDEADGWHFEVDLILEAQDWKISSHSRERGLEATDFLGQQPDQSLGK